MFESVTIFILASNETLLLKKTVEMLLDICKEEDIEKIVIVLKNRTCPSRFEAEKIISSKPDKKLEIYYQKSKSIVGCVGELPELVENSHFIIMASDLETDPLSVGDMIAEAKKTPDCIICASKWHKDSKVTGYGAFHEFGSRTMNSIVSVLYKKRVTDPFSVFQIYPKSVYEKMRFDGSKAANAYGNTLKALRCNLGYREIPTIYEKRVEGKSNFGIFKLTYLAARFLYTAISIRFTSVEKLLK